MRVHALSFRLGFAALGLVAGGAPFLAAPALCAAPKAEKRPIPHDAYDRWRSIQGPTLGRDGRWLAYVLHPQDGDDELVARDLKSGRGYRHPRGKEPVLSADGRFLAFLIVPPKAELDQAKKAKKKPEEMPKAALGVMDLATGKVEILQGVKGFRMPEEGGRFLAVQMEKAADKGDAKADDKADDKADGLEATDAPEAKDGKAKPESGADLVLFELGGPGRITLPEVGDHLWNRDGTALAYAVVPKVPKGAKGSAKEAAEARAGVFLWRPEGTLALRRGRGHDRGLCFDRSGTRLAFLTDAGRGGEAPYWSLHLWIKGEGEARRVAALGTAGLPGGWAPSEHGRLAFTRDGARLFFGSAPRPVAEPKDAPEAVKVDLWHWRDAELQPMQKLRAEDERKRSYRAVLHLASGRCVQLGDRELPEVEHNENPEVALAYAPGPYRAEASWDKGYADVYAVELATGARRILAKRLPVSAQGSHLSPEGKWFVHFDGAQRRWVARSTRDGAARTLGAGLDVHFEQEDDDHPDLPDAYGMAGWSAGDRELLAYDRYDVWALSPEGGSRCLTKGEGRKGRLELRPLRLDPEARHVDLDQPLFLLAEKEDTKATGYARLDPGQAPRTLVLEDRLLGARRPNDRPTGHFLKAKNADTVVLTQQRFDVFPDLWLTDLGFRRMQRLSEANPQQKEFRWGRQELITYVNSDGKPMKALLAKPEDFDPSRKYPLMVYIYEGYSDMLHVYQPPAPGTSINFTRFASHGYLVLRPDVNFEAGYPGKSSVKCVLPAIEQLAAKGFVDRGRIGIQGHSWGGYQVSYLVAQTSLFKAAEAGAPVANMTSAYGGIRWGSGKSRASQYEKGQSRLGDTPWGRPLQYLENSPLFWVERVQTPLLMIHNDGDDAVPWTQGIELFSALRRLGKPAWMFNYNGDKHNLAQRENQKHWTLHLCEFFDHLLLDAPRPAWMDQPVPYAERGKRDLRTVYGR